MNAVKLRTEYMVDPIGIDAARPKLSWVCQDGIEQTAYEVAAYCGKNLVWDSGKVESNSMQCGLDAELHSRDRIEWRVRLWDENGICGKWSEPALFEIAFYDSKEWKAKWINPELQTDPESQKPANYLHRIFTLKNLGSARLYITCHGIYVAWINGKRVGNAVLSPGTSQYNKRLQYQTYDVTELLQSGENEITVLLGDGWYRGKCGMSNKKGNLYGTDVALLCQLEIDKQVIMISDEHWQASSSGPIGLHGLHYGEDVDANRNEISDWHPVKPQEFPYATLVCSNSVPVKEWETFTGKIIRTPNGEKVIDFGQNMAGYVSFDVTAKCGQSIRLIHGETLDKDGNFTIENIQGEGNVEYVRQEINYICAEGINHYKPNLCYFGFQYVKVETDIPVEDIHFTAHAIYSEMEQTGFFTCSDERVNQLVSNTIWSQKSNFTDIPTDCPHRERQGWTGDAQIFAATGSYLMNCYPIYRKWLAELRSLQSADGKLPSVAPQTEPYEGFTKMSAGSSGWGDAIVLVPYVLSCLYNDDSILKDNYEAMKAWVDFCAARARKNRITNWFKRNPWKKYIVDTGFHWGEWMEPGTDIVQVLREMMMKGDPETPTAYFAYSAEIFSKIAGRLGFADDEQKYKLISENAKKGYRTIALTDGEIYSERQCRYVRPIALNLISNEEKKSAAAQLNEIIINNEYHLNTGFLSTVFLCGVLSDYGYTDTAYQLLLQDTCPSWLYAVKMGANTIWENWDSRQEDGTVRRSSMNHYSYGAVVGWLFSDVCGIKVDHTSISVAPKPNKRLGYAQAAYESVLGRIESAWRYEGDEIIYDISVPSNAEAWVSLPGERTRNLKAGNYHFCQKINS